MSRDYYKVLGVDEKADAAAIKKKYRELAKKYHPDRNHGDKASEEKFKDIQEAYDILGDEKKRKVYDQYGFYSDNIPSGGYPGGFSKANLFKGSAKFQAPRHCSCVLSRFYGQATKGVRWMPWRQTAKKDVVTCDKPRLGGNTL